MRYFRFLSYVVLSILLVLAGSTYALSREPQLSCLRFNFGAWDMPGVDVGIGIYHTDLANNERLTEADIYGPSATFSFSHKIGSNFAWELSLGGFTNTETETLSRRIDSRYRDEYYEVISSDSRSVSVAYTTLGLIYYPFEELSQLEPEILDDITRYVRPYLTAGIGYYFGWDATWDEDAFTDVYSSSTIGVYPGIGMDLLLSRHFILNFDLRHHFVEFGEALKGLEDYSGTNIVAGFKVGF